MKVEVSDDSLPKGTEVFVSGLGMLVNGESTEIDDEAVAKFESETGQKITEAFAENVNVHIGGAKAPAKTEEKKKEGGE